MQYIVYVTVATYSEYLTIRLVGHLVKISAKWQLIQSLGALQKQGEDFWLTASIVFCRILALAVSLWAIDKVHLRNAFKH